MTRCFAKLVFGATAMLVARSIRWNPAFSSLPTPPPSFLSSFFCFQTRFSFSASLCSMRRQTTNPLRPPRRGAFQLHLRPPQIHGPIHSFHSSREAPMSTLRSTGFLACWRAARIRSTSLVASFALLRRTWDSPIRKRCRSLCDATRNVSGSEDRSASRSSRSACHIWRSQRNRTSYI